MDAISICDNFCISVELKDTPIHAVSGAGSLTTLAPPLRAILPRGERGASVAPGVPLSEAADAGSVGHVGDAASVAVQTHDPPFDECPEEAQSGDSIHAAARRYGTVSQPA